MGARRPAAVWQFQLVYAVLVANFFIPSVSYIVAPQIAVAQLGRLNAQLGGGPLPAPESGHLWHMLAVGNVMTLAFLCALLLVDLRRFYAVLPGLAFLKGFSSLYSLAIGVANGIPAFLAVFVLDGVTTAAMVFFARRAHRALVTTNSPPG